MAYPVFTILAANLTWLLLFFGGRVNWALRSYMLHTGTHKTNMLIQSPQKPGQAEKQTLTLLTYMGLNLTGKLELSLGKNQTLKLHSFWAHLSDLAPPGTRLVDLR